MSTKWYLQGGEEASRKKSPNAGRSIMEILWEELDDIMDRLMEDGEPSVNDHLIGKYPIEYDIGELQEAFKLWGEERGKAQATAYAIAIMTNPYQPSIPDIKAEAMRRWQERQD